MIQTESLLEIKQFYDCLKSKITTLNMRLS